MLVTYLCGVLEKPAEVDDDGEDKNAAGGEGGGPVREAVVGPSKSMLDHVENFEHIEHIEHVEHVGHTVEVTLRLTHCMETEGKR